MSAPNPREVVRLLELLDGTLSRRAARRLQKRLDRDAALAEEFSRVVRARQLCHEIGQQDPPEIAARKIEAQIHWQLARRDAAGGRTPYLPRLAIAVTIALLLGAGIGIFAYRLLKPSSPAAHQSPALFAGNTTEMIPGEPRGTLAALPTLASGDVTIGRTDGSMMPLDPARPVLVGERVITGSQGMVLLQWAEGDGLQLLDNSDLQLGRLTPRDQIVQLWQGQVFVQLRPRTAGRQSRKFALDTGHLRVEVTGTYFSVKVDTKATEVAVYEGRVRVVPAGSSGDTTYLAAGEHMRFVHDEPDTQKLPAVSAEPLPLQPWPSLYEILATTGLLTVHSDPQGAMLRFDSLLLGETDLTLRSPQGRHRLELWRDGRRIRSQWVEIEAGARNRLALSLKPVRRRSRFAALPKGIYRTIRRRMPEIRRCYERLLKRDPSLSGQFQLRFIVESDGEVSDARVDNDTMPVPTVAECAVNVVRRWRFPPGNESEVVYPFVFRPQDVRARLKLEPSGARFSDE